MRPRGGSRPEPHDQEGAALTARLRVPLVLVLVMLATLGASASAQASSTSTAQAAGRHVLAHEFVNSEVGAYVRIRAGVGIFVPPGVMLRSGYVTITKIRRGVYDVHIGVPWRGTVAVSMPLRDSTDVVLHHVGGLWLAEGAHRGERTVWVTQLSWFTTLVTKAKDAISGALCLSFSLTAVESCLSDNVASRVEGAVVSWIEARLPQNCAVQLAASGVSAVLGGPKAILLSVIKQAGSGACVGSAGETGFHVPTGPPAPASQPAPVAPAPTPSPSPPSSPSPSPPPAATFDETTGSVVHTWTDYLDAGGDEGPEIPSNATVEIACRVTGFAVKDGNTWWYRIASPPWDGDYYGSADAFYNNGETSGSLLGTPFVDPNVPTC